MNERTPEPPAGTGRPGGPWQPWQAAGPWVPGAGDRLRPWHGAPGYRHYRRRGPGRWRGPRGEGPLRRSRDDRLAGGVAAGLAQRTGFDVTFIRIGFIITALASGFGAAAYVVAWLLVPAAGDGRSVGSKALADRRGLALAAGLASLLMLVLAMAGAVGVRWAPQAAWPLVISLAGLTLIWRNAPAEEAEVLRRLAQPLAGMAGGASPRAWAVRMLAGTLLVAGGLATLWSWHRGVFTLQPLAGVALVVAGFVVVLGPWWLRIARDLVLERQARARAEERADMAARVHDSVLQTLALIQRRAGDPQQVIQLARAQERELRSWLFDGPPPGPLADGTTTLAAGVRLIQQEVEAQHGISVEAVTVGDCQLTEDLAALLAAGREATVNAAKWSGAPVVSLFAEVEPAAVSLFVRDRGRGFDPAAVPADRKGVAESIRARMARRGGTATIRSAPGEGTEVSLSLTSPTGFTMVTPGQRGQD